MSAITQGVVTPNPNPTTDQVTVTTVDAANVINADYRIGFKPACATCANRVWYVVRTVGAAVDTVVNNWPDFTASDANPIFDGIQVKIKSFDPGVLARVAYVDTAGGNPAALDGVDVGLPFWSGGAGYAADLFGSSIDSGTPGPNARATRTSPCCTGSTGS